MHHSVQTPEKKKGKMKQVQTPEKKKGKVKQQQQQVLDSTKAQMNEFASRFKKYFLQHGSEERLVCGQWRIQAYDIILEVIFKS